MQYVYLLRAGENHYKVGVAKSVKKRLAGIQTSNPVPIDVVSIKLLDDAYAVEGQLHERLKQWNVSGEWFSLEPQQVIDLLIEIGKYPEPDLAISIRLRDILAEQLQNQKRIEAKLSKVTDLAEYQLRQRQEKLESPKPEPTFKEPKISLSDEQLAALASDVIKSGGKASTSYLQRKLKIGYGRAARIMEQLEEQGAVSPLEGSRARQVLI